MNKIPVFIFASPQVQELLADNDVDLISLLSQEGVDVDYEFGQDPTVNQATGYREPAIVILASAALVLALTPLISRVINKLTHKSIVVQEMVLVPVEDSQGNVIHDAAGNPILQWVKRTKIIESSEKVSDKNEMTLEGLGIKLTFKDLEEG